MNRLKALLSDAKAVLLAPFTNIMCFGGVTFLAASFADYDKANGLSLHGDVHWTRFVTGCVLVVVSVILYLRTHHLTGSFKKPNYEKGVEIKRGGLTILIKTGTIQTIQDTTKNCAVVLPANTTFVDDCATDRRTAMGAFFTEKFPEAIAELPTLLKEALDAREIRPAENGQYTPATTIILPDKFAQPSKVLVTASTTRTPEAGIASTPHTICACVGEIMKMTVDQRIDTIYTPILGSGHGGVERGMALLLLLLAAIHFSKLYHHIRTVHIVIHSKDVSILNQSKELCQVLAF